MNSKIEITSGKPKPPFLMMAPSGAPIKNSKIHEKANVNFLDAHFGARTEDQRHNNMDMTKNKIQLILYFLSPRRTCS